MVAAFGVAPGVFNKIAEIEPVLKALETAAEAGELDAVLAAAARRGKPEASK